MQIFVFQNVDKSKRPEIKSRSVLRLAYKHMCK